MIGQFLLLVLAQAVFINGFATCMDEGMILNGYKKWLDKKPKWFSKPMGLCVRCASSTLGSLTYWITVLIVFGWHWQEIPVWVADVFSLVTVNFFIYKNV